MLKDLLIGKSLPLEVKTFSKNSWDILIELYSNRYPSIKFEFKQTETELVREIEESLDNEVVFNLTRNVLTDRRITHVDKYGLLGLSLINPLDDKVILTEGVSDYFTAKLLCPQNNVLGVTTLGGSDNAKRILINLFNKFIICSDNDFGAKKNTGVNNSQNWRNFLTTYNKSVNIFLPELSCKDITENLIRNINLNKL